VTPQQFIRKWSASTLKESSGAQQHFLDLCSVVGVPPPAEADPEGKWFAFERGAKKAGGGDGWADVWRKKHFAWEYKGKRKDLDAAYAQLQRYAPALENPPLLVVSDMERIRIHTNFTNTVHAQHDIPIAEFGKEENLRKLKWLFTEPERLRPGKTKAAITEDAAQRFAALAQVLRHRGAAPERVAHFLNRILFCLFAQHAKLLPDRVVDQLLEAGLQRPDHSNRMLGALFKAMKEGGEFGHHVIQWFNGHLFESGDTIPLEQRDIRELLAVADLDWSAIEPSIFGTLFERGLDPDKRSQIGAHYTDPNSIMQIVDPVVVEPLVAAWRTVHAEIVETLIKADRAQDRSASTKYRRHAQQTFNAYLERLRAFRVLDPACGSGNFLYLALQSLKDLEHKAILDAEHLGLEPPLEGMHVGVHCVRGIESNPYAAELARVTVWIGEIQWMLRHGMEPSKNPILKPLKKTIECRDAVIDMDRDGAEPSWPPADVIIGNPPFLGNKKMNAELGEKYAKHLRRRYEGRVPASADFVCYWFEKARAQLAAGQGRYAGLVGTNSIRHGTNRKVLDRIVASGSIFDARSDQDWINEGAAVRVSLVSFASSAAPVRQPRLDGETVRLIHADLTAETAESSGKANATPNKIDLTRVRRLAENADVAYMGITKVGPFDIEGHVARSWMKEPNPHGRSNADVLRPSWNGLDVTRRPRDKWIVDFGTSTSVAEAALYEAPFAWVRENVRPERAKNNREVYKQIWWRHGEPRPALRAKIATLRRYIATPEVSKHRVFVWAPTSVLPEKNLHVFTRDDDVAFGVLQSRLHAVWALRLCSWLGVGNDPRYTPSTTFDTFPFPNGLTLDRLPKDYENVHANAIAKAAIKLNELRQRWLNPPEWVDTMPEIVSGYPDRLVPKPAFAEQLKKRTLTNLYNDRPTWLDDVHAELDHAVAAAYGWTDYTATMTDEAIVARLLKLNAARAPDLFTPDESHLAVVNTKRTKKPAIRIANRRDLRAGRKGREAA
jgi:hypothetical protein